MVKSYLKFEVSSSFGQICSPLSNIIWDPRLGNTSTRTKSNLGRAFVAANEDVLIWDLKKAEILSRWSAVGNLARVTCLERSQIDPDVFAIGYEDGKIRIWDQQTATVILTFNGHKSAVTQLKFDRTGVRLASGAKDTDIIVWDLVSEVGLFRLRGHKDQITSLNFLRQEVASDSGTVARYDNEPDEYLLSTSKDALIKIWDLSTQHCIETQLAQDNGECWTLGLSPDSNGCITAGNDGEVKAWVIDYDAMKNATKEAVPEATKILKCRGTFYRNGKDRAVGVSFHPTKDLLALHGSDKSVELWRIRSDEEVQKSLKRKRKRRAEKGLPEEESENDSGDETGKTADLEAMAPITEVFVPYVIVRTTGKVRSFDWAADKAGRSVAVLVATTNNQLELFDVDYLEAKQKISERPDYSRSISIDSLGHRTDVRSLALSSDDRMLASASHGSLKVWNVKTQSCLRTLDCGYALCVTFLPGDKIVVIGTREGTLEIFDIAASILLETVAAHDHDIWTIQVNPDGKSIITGSADKSVKFWELRVVQEEVLGTNRKVPKLTLVHTRTLKTADDVLAVRFSPDARFLAVSTLDNTVKVFFVDSLKLFLSLHGHKLPVLSIDISYDSKLIITSSADKNVRVWGLDFGDCHKAFFAHQDSILAVSFVPNNDDGNGHHFFSASKDRVIKYFDGDKFEQIQKLEGHHGEIWAMAIARSGQFIVSASHDKSIRIWQQTDEQIFLEEEREKELEELYENTLVASLEPDDADANGDGVTTAGKQTVQTLMAGEKIAEALELGIEDVELMQEYERAKLLNPKTGYPQRHAIFLANNNVSASQYVQSVFQKIPLASLQDALLVVSFSQLPILLRFIALWASESRNIPLTCRVLFFMVKTHQRQIVSSEMMRSTLEDVRSKLRRTLQRHQHELGFNLAGLRVTRRRLEAIGETEFVDFDVWNAASQPVSGTTKKRGFVSIA